MRTIVLGALFGIPMIAPAFAGVTFIQADTYASGYEASSWNGAGVNSSGNYYDPETAAVLSDASVGNPLDSSGNASTSFSKHGQSSSGSVAGDTNAALSSAAAGTVLFTSTTSATVKQTENKYANNSGYAYAYNYGSFDYYFSTTQNSKIKINFNNSASPASSYYYDYVEVWNSVLGTVASYNVAVNGSGLNTFSLPTGTDYLYIYSYYPDYIYQSGPGSQTGYNNGDFNFSISAVPEPSSWMLMMLGFAGLGFVAHRQMKKNSAALAAA